LYLLDSSETLSDPSGPPGIASLDIATSQTIGRPSQARVSGDGPAVRKLRGQWVILRQVERRPGVV
jgi:hypothetical protein